MKIEEMELTGTSKVADLALDWGLEAGKARLRVTYFGPLAQETREFSLSPDQLKAVLTLFTFGDEGNEHLYKDIGGLFADWPLSLRPIP